jgi:uncharacterized protein (DUF608 family)
MKPISYKGENLRAIKFLLGGLGTGSVSLEGRGSLSDWEIFNRPSKGNVLYGNFIALKIIHKEPVIKILARKPFPPFEGSSGLRNLRMEGFPHFAEAEFVNFFPFAFINFIERNFPLKITLSAYSPFIPLDDENSSLPIAIFEYKLKNISKKKINLSIAFSMMNPVGTDGTEKLDSPYNKCFGKNLNIFVKEDAFSGVLFTSNKYNKNDIRYGNICLASDSEDVYFKNIVPGSWWREFREFFDEFEKGKVVNNYNGETGEGQTLIGILIVNKEIMPYGETNVKFYLSWYFPNRVNYWGLDEEVKDKILKNWYAKKFNSSTEVIKYFKEREGYLESKSRRFAEIFFSSAMPKNFLNAISSQLHTLRSNTFLRVDDYFYGFEGSSDNHGCCPLNCTHVYNYEQAIAYLFPKIERKMREADYLYNVDENGYMSFRTNIPLGIKIWRAKPAADGHAGTVLKVYREWKISGDGEFLKKIYPNLKKSFEFIWKEWDVDKDGLMEGEQHNTYDVEFYGPNPFTSFIYIASCKAMAEISQFMDDTEFSNLCNEVYEKGRKNILSLWNGYYFAQKCNKEPLPPFQFLNGCLTSQLLGQALSDILGLGNIVDEKYIRKTLSSVLRFNFKRMSLHKNYMRIFAIDDEEGILICTWPFNDRPDIPMPYCDEVWDGGEEFVIAGMLLKRGKINEATEIINAVVKRHDGIKRNPFNYAECGHHYARPLSCWILVLTWAGFLIDNVKKSISFAPIVFRKKFTLFFSSGYAWGTYKYSILPKIELFEIVIESGFLEIKEISLKFWENKKTKNIEIKIDGTGIKNFKFSERGNLLSVTFESLQKAERNITILRFFA